VGLVLACAGAGLLLALRLEAFVIAVPTAWSTTLSETPLCTALLTAFSIALTAFFLDFFFAILIRPDRRTAYHHPLSLLHVIFPSVVAALS
jgi:hypothetical protein